MTLKVDVDTKVGFIHGVRNLADLMAEKKVKASYFLSMGPDNSGRALKRLFRPGFLAKQMRSGAASAYGPVTMLYGLLLPGPIIAKAAPNLPNRLINEGHEVGIHAWDHVFWHDCLRRMGRARLSRELGLAFGLFEDITGFWPGTFASPGWQITDQAFEALFDIGVRHVSTTRGVRAFFPRLKDKTLPLLEIPTTLPTLDEILGRNGVTRNNAAKYLADLVKPEKLNVFTLHGEVEGREMAFVLKEFLQRLLDRGVVFERLIETADRILSETTPPALGYYYGELPGRAGDMALEQGFAPRENDK
ncbi:polysaccharide deacetylase [Dethiosulfatarculus sandiegensis]|uniref:Polysaccharide deacetylase n=1 Tax=Dethiosulfatarculus sandiegensis TaxID=1429043 RepID=A0A0D2HQY4_9BACT|nr:polysaccharide deacetylase [Dethiosulfatarculus sandiegensis]